MVRLHNYASKLKYWYKHHGNVPDISIMHAHCQDSYTKYNQLLYFSSNYNNNKINEEALFYLQSLLKRQMEFLHFQLNLLEIYWRILGYLTVCNKKNQWVLYLKSKHISSQGYQYFGACMSYLKQGSTMQQPPTYHWIMGAQSAILS